MATRAAQSGQNTKVKRTPVGTRNVLSLKGEDPNFVYRIVNDAGDRIAAFQDGGWEIVDASTVRVGDKRVNNATPEGSKAQVSVGRGDKAFVMRIPKEMYVEDQQTKQTAIDELEKTMKQTASGLADYGAFNISR